jgi:integrase/recombinase XerC
MSLESEDIMFNQTESQQAQAANQMQFMQPDELEDVLIAARKHSLRDAALILCGYVHGLRASEAVAIKLTDINWQSETLTVARKKGSMLTTQALESHRGKPHLDQKRAIREYIKSRINDGSSFLFVSQKGSSLLPTTATALFYKYCELASEERIRNGKTPIARSCWNFKILKHSRGTHMVTGNANPYLIKQQLGHTHFSSTQVYLHGSQKQANAAAAQVSMEVFS